MPSISTTLDEFLNLALVVGENGYVEWNERSIFHTITWFAY